MGEVYRATRRPARPARRAEGARRRSPRTSGFASGCSRESRLAASLDHPNVIPIYEAGEQDGRLFIAMRYVRGGDLQGAAAPRGSARARASGRDRRAGRRRARRRPPQRPRPPRRQAEQRAARPRGRPRALLPGRLRAHPERLRAGADRRAVHGHASPTSRPSRSAATQIDGRADQYALACLLFECLTGTVPFGGRSDVAVIFAHLEEPRPPASGRRAELPAAVDAVLARGDGQGPRRALRELRRARAQPRGRRWAWARPPRGARRLARSCSAVAAAAASRPPRSRSPCCGRRRRQRRPRRRARSCAWTRRTNAVVGRSGRPRPSGRARRHARRLWMADFRDGVLWRYEPGSRPARADHLERRAARPRRARRQGLRRGGRALPSAASSPATTPSTGVREDGIDLLACAMASGEGVLWAAGCPFVQRLSTGDGRLRKLREVFLPFRTRRRWRTRGSSSASSRSAPARCGCSATRSTGGCGGSTPAPVAVQATIELGFPPTSVAVAAGASGSPTASHDRVVPIDIDERDGCWRRSRSAAGPSGIAVGRRRRCGSRTRSTARVSRMDPARRGRRGGDGRGGRAAARPRGRRATRSG